MDTITKAKIRLDALAKQIQQLEGERDELHQFLSLHEKWDKRLAVSPTIGLPDTTRPSAVERAISLSTVGVKEPNTSWYRVYFSQMAANATMKDRVLEGASLILQNRDFAHTREIVDLLQNVGGLKITGYDPVQTVSAILGKDDRFIPDRRNGWSLKRASPETVGAVGALGTNDSRSEST